MGHTEVSIEDRVAYITIDRAEVHNAINSRMRDEELVPHLEDLRKNDDVKVVVLQTTGEIFSSGGDMMEVIEMDFTPEKYKKRITRAWDHLYWELLTLEKPTITKVDGDMLAGAANISLYVDIVIASEEAEIGFPEVNHGIFTASQVSRLPYFVGPRQAMYLLLTGKSIPARKAEEIGLVTKAVPEDQLEETIASVIDSLVDKHPLILEYMRDAVNISLEMNYPAANRRIKQRSLALHRNDPPMVEGIEAFFEGRDPAWKE